MKYHWDKKYLYWGVTAFLVIASGIIFYYGIFNSDVLGSGLTKITDILMPIIYGLVIAYILNPFVSLLEKKVFLKLIEKNRPNRKQKTEKKIRNISILTTLIIMVMLLYGLLNLLIPQLIKSIQTIIQSLPSYYENFQSWLGEIIKKNPQLENSTSEMLEQASAYFQSWLNSDILPKLKDTLISVSTGFMDFVNILKNLVVGLIISIYVMSSKEKFAAQSKKLVYAIMKPKQANRIITGIRFVNTTFIKYISGMITDSMIIGIICFIVTSLLNIPYGVLISVIIGCTNIIPFFGPYIGGIPSAFLILLVDPLKCLYFIIFIMLLQLVDGNIIAPKILGDSTGLSSFWVVFAILIGGGIFGIPGMFIGVPVFAVIYAFIKISVSRSLEARNLPGDTESYMNLDLIQSAPYDSKMAPVTPSGHTKAEKTDEEKTGK